MTNYSAEYIRAVAFDLQSPRPETVKTAQSMAQEILNNLAADKEKANAKKKAYRESLTAKK